MSFIVGCLSPKGLCGGSIGSQNTDTGWSHLVTAHSCALDVQQDAGLWEGHPIYVERSTGSKTRSEIHLGD